MFSWPDAGPHHLHYTSLPDWAQTLGMVFSVVLLIFYAFSGRSRRR